MKVSCLPVSFFSTIQSGRMSVKDWARLARTCGLDAIDLSILLIKNHTSVYLDNLKRDLEQEQMTVTMVTAYPDYTHPDRLQRERERDYFSRDIALASEIGAKYLRITAGQAHPEMGIREGVRLTVENFKMAADMARRYNIRLLFENHSKPGCWKYADFSHPSSIFLEIVHGIRDTDIGINFDTANTLVAGEDVLRVLDEVMDRIETVHAADTAAAGELKPVVIGTGAAPIARVMEKLKSQKFDGWICIEEASNTGVAGVKRAVDFIRGTWSGI